MISKSQRLLGHHRYGCSTNAGKLAMILPAFAPQKGLKDLTGKQTELTHMQAHSDTNMKTLIEYIIQINSLKMPSLRSLWGGMQSFGMGSFLQAFLNGTFFLDLSALR